jgi:hypothetical protein
MIFDYILLLVLWSPTATTYAFRPPENPANVNLVNSVIKPRVDLRSPPPPPSSSSSTVTTINNKNDSSLLTTTISSSVTAPELSYDVLNQVGKTVAAKRDDTYHAQVRKRWGMDLASIIDENEYWDDPRIHTFGNAGFRGAIHAALAPVSTKVIDIVAYDGQDIRSIVRVNLRKHNFYSPPLRSHPNQTCF